jgi:hypothetical protein
MSNAKISFDPDWQKKYQSMIATPAEAVAQDPTWRTCLRRHRMCRTAQLVTP